MKKIVVRGRWVLAALLLSALAVLIAVEGGALATRAYFGEAYTRGETTLRLAVAALRGHLNRYEALPALIADHALIKRLVIDPQDSGDRAAANAYLSAINTLLESSDIYVMLTDGTTVAASNYDGPASFVGENFSYRPYFQEAVQGRQGRFFALGTTSLKRGYYFSAPIVVDAAVRGVVVFKIDIDAIEASWRGGDHEIIVADPEGIIFMTGRPEWLYTSLLPLTPDRLARTEASRRYADTRLEPLSFRQAADQGYDLMRMPIDGRDREFLVLSEQMPEAGWTVRVLLDTASVRSQTFTSVMVALLLLGLATLIGFVVLQRRARLYERMQIQRQAREELEHRVAERTADLAGVNSQLEKEVAERRATESQLRRTQADLVQAGKLAALGQMSAALSHEFNQPLAAVKTYADNAAILIDRDRLAEARDNVTRISSLTDRMATLSRHLRNFARKPNQKLQPVALADVVEDALEIVAWRLKAAGTAVTVDLGPVPLAVRAGPVRLQQVLVNLLSNAADAVEALPERRIVLTARQEEHKVVLAVHDNGSGVAAAIRERIFDPFFTTKGVGKGLGLGLSITYNIVKDFGGELSVADDPEGGAVFTVVLDAARMPAREAAE
ncbi:sensor histidine kinase [Chelativorans sp. AA-79]|uniref:sensor histidine kinase n=1 Tax=Chelativorans sp. AA-79 TaxID=3028735 RepID=UPI0023F9F218|nr:sensor histidine kinase [Chelativorans sp. AA-79]WEX11000.1 sensor histidine kinase [Chelativorans sp. AA-79]